jgi:5-methylcytosine-specific restriction enzyme B
MALADLTSRDAVLAAMEEFDNLGRGEFLPRYGFGRARDYEVVYDGKRYDSKAIVGAAHGHQHPSLGPLKSGDFSGGEPTISKLRDLGFDVVQIDHSGSPSDRTAARLAQFLELYPAARQVAFTGEHEASDALRAAAASLGERLRTTLPQAKVKPSVGQGNWARVPWIAVLDPRETNSTQHGTYPVILIPESLDGIYMTLAQGVTDLKQELGRRGAYEEMRRRADVLRPSLTTLLERRFEFGGDVSLGESPFGRDYAASVIASKYVPASEISHSPVEDDMAHLGEAYEELLVRGALHFDDGPLTGPQVLCVYVGRGASTNFETGGRQGWWGWRSAPTGLESLRPGDLVLFGRGYTGGSPRVDIATWQTGALDGAVVGRLEEPPSRTDETVMPDELAGEASYPWKFRFSLLGEHSSVPLRTGDALSAPAADAVRKSAIDRGHGQLAPIAGSPLLERYLEVDGISPQVTLKALAESFWAEIERSGMQLDHDRTLAFLAAALSKPFIILTGQSGSGKTQLAQRLGEWCGVDSNGRPRYVVVPVRPDWTGPEYLFGYPDGLRPKVDDRAVWSVPNTLEFIFRAHADPSFPYVLVLDEMNLAHVERYFADFLSGIESREPVLPALDLVDGEWVDPEHGEQWPIPTNLIVVGTVNVDETTYMFSPKVLDRAFTFEFRVGSEDLDGTIRRPAPAGAAPSDVLARLVETVRDDELQFGQPHPDHLELLEDLRELHTILSRAGLDFGHRVVYEALRFAALLHAATEADRDHALDFITVTKLLPKIHGSRQRLEPVLRDLITFATGDSGASAGEEPDMRLPYTKEKLNRMLATLLDAQFVSFTE